MILIVNLKLQILLFELIDFGNIPKYFSRISSGFELIKDFGNIPEYPGIWPPDDPQPKQINSQTIKVAHKDAPNFTT